MWMKEIKKMSDTGNRIRQIREEKKMTQEQLAKASGISKGFLSDVENNNKNISAQSLLRIANTLGASVDYLLRGEAAVSVSTEPVVIPHELSEAAGELKLSYAETLELLDAYTSVVARRSNKSRRYFSVEDWKNLHRAIKKAFG
jgi:transcriptional regulator with XRE-family HTH domain